MPAASFAWHWPQNSRVCGIVGVAARGDFLCCSGTVWQVVHASSAWLETAFVRSICPWHAEQSRGVRGGTGSCALWQVMHGFSGLWAVGLICGKPVGRAGS